jgi:hypothetical protein
MIKTKIDKRDKFRVLLTEILPYEVPMLFSNIGFYKIAKNNEQIYFFEKIKDISTNKTNIGLPFDYEISKGLYLGSRKLSIIHPFNQLDFTDFYSKYDVLIQYYCSQSPFSLRKIKSIASQTVSSDLIFNNEKIQQSPGVETYNNDDKIIYRSYFTYEPINLIYKFYESFDYRRLEQRFSFMLKFDISKCFYNIYSHSLTWAIKGKEKAKKDSAKNTFENKFDKIMQQSNYNETNGILVGPEVSRLFAEIILSRIDQNVYEKLLKYELKKGKDYEIRRYIDDYFIYTNNEKISNKIKSILTKEIEYYKLYSNEKKCELNKTPFISDISVGKHEVRKLITSYIEAIFSKKEEGNEIDINANFVSTPYKAADEFIKQFQYIVKRNNLDYDVLSRDVVRHLLSEFKSALKTNLKDRFEEEQYGNFLLFYMNVLFYVYSLGINVSSTFKVAQSIILIHKSLKKVSFAMRENVLSKMVSEIDFVMSIYLSKTDSKETNINILNLLIAMSKLGDRYLLTPKDIYKILRIEDVKSTSQLNYFEIVTIIYYIKDNPIYIDLKKKIFHLTIAKFSVESPFTKSELFMLFFDLISCPFLNNDQKRKLCRTVKYPSSNLSKLKLDEEIGKIYSKKHWFFNWDENINMEAILKAKEWSRVY